MRFLGKRKKQDEAFSVQTAASRPFSSMIPMAEGMSVCERRLYRELKERIPIIDAAINKLVRLTGGFSIVSEDEDCAQMLNDFLETVPVNGGGYGIGSFLSVYLDQLLTYGTAVGEMVTDRSGRQITALYNASLDDAVITAGDNPLNVSICRAGSSGAPEPVKYPALVMYSTILNEPGKITGTSVLRGLPFVGELLMKIFCAIGTNWDRVGNVRFAVSYKPTENERSFSKERAKQIASEWSKAMKSTEPKDFVSVGDVSIRVIGAENQIPDSGVPVRQLLEQIIAKLSVPPFLLGLSWSSTERMSAQQADILTSEIDYYRKSLEGCIRKICDMLLTLNGRRCRYRIKWENINLQDEVELARARLLNAQAERYERDIK